ncbi:hypothetical protein ONA91_16095, partial [Micromonospora sp. DR5-3]|uniref:hypothetical protein n=1 Tax=Micromonospora sp. DR5-3 TaxID=2992129 RepID=UPI002230DC62
MADWTAQAALGELTGRQLIAVAAPPTPPRRTLHLHTVCTQGVHDAHGVATGTEGGQPLEGLRKDGERGVRPVRAQQAGGLSLPAEQRVVRPWKALPRLGRPGEQGGGAEEITSVAKSSETRSPL